jgi:hypothetical protein
MESTYDIKAWAGETTLGRRVFNYNFRMIGREARVADAEGGSDAQGPHAVRDDVSLAEERCTSRVERFDVRAQAAVLARNAGGISSKWIRVCSEAIAGPASR